MKFGKFWDKLYFFKRKMSKAHSTQKTYLTKLSFEKMSK